jgi:hypothetical protein
MNEEHRPSMDTSQRIRHVFACTGETVHVHPGFAILLTGQKVCPTCGMPVYDITETPLGLAYYAFARPDLWRKSQ